MIRGTKDLTKGSESIEVSVKVNGQIVLYRVASYVSTQGNMVRYKLDDGTSLVTRRDHKNMQSIAAQILARSAK